jgi:hypothetical protein
MSVELVAGLAIKKDPAGTALGLAPVATSGSVADLSETADNKVMTSAEREKLASIEAGANVTNAGNVGNVINGVATKATPVGMDKIAIIDSEADGALKSVFWSDVPAALNVKPLNADGGLSLTTTTTSEEWANGVFGGSWRVASRRHSSSPSTYAGARATEAVVREVMGNANGPSTADYASLRSVLKTNYLTSLAGGEINVDFLTVGQGVNGDCSGTLSDINKVAGGTGGALAHESSVNMRDSSGAIVRAVQAIKNFQEGAGGVSGGKGYGFWTEARAGDPYSAYHADQDQTASGAAWANFLTYTKDRTAASMIYRVDGAGRTYTSNGSQGIPAYTFVSDTNTGMYRVGEDAVGFSTGGVIRAYVASNGSILPGSDNAYSLGAVGTARFANAYFVNAPTVGSDARSKTAIIDSPLGLEIIPAQRAVAYRLREGGVRIEMVDVEEEVEEPVTEDGDVWIDDSYFDGAAKVKRYRKERGQVQVYDREAVLDADGNPVFEEVVEAVVGEDGLPVMELVPREALQYRDSEGNLHKQEQPAVLTQVTRTVRRPVLRAIPRMQKVKRIFQVPVDVPIEGKRQHFGLLAQEVRASLPDGVDFAGWLMDDVNDPKSAQALRYEEFIAPLIKANQELAALAFEIMAVLLSGEPISAKVRARWINHPCFAKFISKLN